MPTLKTRFTVKTIWGLKGPNGRSLVPPETCYHRKQGEHLSYCIAPKTNQRKPLRAIRCDSNTDMNPSCRYSPDN